MFVITAKKKLDFLLTNLSLLKAIGTPLTIQIDLAEVGPIERSLQYEFRDSDKEGYYTDNMIIIEYIEGKTDYAAILKKLIDLVVDIDNIGDITALVGIEINTMTIETTLQLSASNSPPQILAAADNSLYFKIAEIVQTKWSVAKQLLIM